MSAEGGEKVDDASSKAANAAEESTRLAEYNRHLSALNRSVSKWIQVGGDRCADTGSFSSCYCALRAVEQR